MRFDFTFFRIKDPVETNGVIWYAVGACLLLLTLTTVLLHALANPVWLLIACAGGVVLSSMFQVFGAILASIGIIAIQMPTSFSYPSSVITASFLLSFFIMGLSAYEVKRKLSSRNSAREESEKNNAMHQSLTQHHSTAVSQALPIEDQVHEIPETPVLAVAGPLDGTHQYKQLREQFEEKSQVLRETRKQLFVMENALFAKEREILEGARADLEGWREFQELLYEVQKQQEMLEEQLIATENLVSDLLKIPDFLK